MKTSGDAGSNCNQVEKMQQDVTFTECRWGRNSFSFNLNADLSNFSISNHHRIQSEIIMQIFPFFNFVLEFNAFLEVYYLYQNY